MLLSDIHDWRCATTGSDRCTISRDSGASWSWGPIVHDAARKTYRTRPNG